MKQKILKWKEEKIISGNQNNCYHGRNLSQLLIGFIPRRHLLKLQMRMVFLSRTKTGYILQIYGA